MELTCSDDSSKIPAPHRALSNFRSIHDSPSQSRCEPFAVRSLASRTHSVGLFDEPINGLHGDKTIVRSQAFKFGNDPNRQLFAAKRVDISSAE